MRSRLGAVLAAAALVAGAGAAAMTVDVQGSTVFASGPVVDDLQRFEQALAAPGVDTVVFVNSPGGDLWTGLRVGRLIAERQLRTVTAGSCISACSIMFMGGRERRFADAFPPNLTYVGLHGAHRIDTRQVDPALQPQLFAFYRQRMGAAFDAAVMNQALYEMDDAGALLRVFDNAREPRRPPYHCRSQQTPRRACSELAQHDALSLGVVTAAALVTVALPPQLQAPAVVFNQALGASVGDVQAWLDGLVAGACRSDGCRDRLGSWPTRRDHWALALRAGGGWGRAEGRDTPQQAAAAALYSCNHVQGQAAGLCELAAVDGLDARLPLQQALQAHAAALQRVAPPADKFYANEEFGGGLTSASGLRTQRLSDITPGEISGVRTVGTRELVALLVGPAPPVLIDVSGNPPQSLPGALALWNGGAAYDDAKADDALDARFRALLALLAPERSQPVVFYCPSRSCWLSVNAALRARRAGWQQVLWYRGGLEAWRAAGLPTAAPVVRAVAQ